MEKGRLSLINGEQTSKIAEQHTKASVQTMVSWKPLTIIRK